MKKRNSIAIAGGFLGFLTGSSVGIAAGGTAVNGAWVLALTFALIGWLLGRNLEGQSKSEEGNQPTSFEIDHEIVRQTSFQPAQTPDTITAVLKGVLEFAASLWNLHIDILDKFNLLDAFCDKPWLFFIFAVVVSFVFPPFGVAYFIAYICAHQLGAEASNKFRANLNT